MKIEKQKGGSMFLTPNEDVKDQELVKITTEGELVDTDWGQKIKVEVETPKGEVKTFSMNKTSMNNMIDAYGEDTAKWVGEKAKCHVMKSMIDDKLRTYIILTHPDGNLES